MLYRSSKVKLVCLLKSRCFSVTRRNTKITSNLDSPDLKLTSFSSKKLSVSTFNLDSKLVLTANTMPIKTYYRYYS